MPTTKKIEFYSYDATPNGSVKISSLMKQFQQIAREDLQSYGVTYNMMRDVNQVFVIIKARIEFKKKISIYDELFLRTVPVKITGITFFRDFCITDKNGNVCVMCTTSWVLMNYESRRILKPKEIVLEIPHFPDEDLGLTLTRRFNFEESPFLKSTNVRKVYFSNLDENNHFNNAETVAFALDEVASRIIDGENISVFEIHFNHESNLDDELLITAEHRNKSSFVSAFNSKFEANAFDCLIEFD